MLAGAWGVKNSTWKENGWRDEMERDLRIAVFGQKRLSREGGVEIVVKELCTRMAQQGCQVTCYNRSGHRKKNGWIYVGKPQNSKTYKANCIYCWNYIYVHNL